MSENENFIISNLCDFACLDFMSFTDYYKQQKYVKRTRGNNNMNMKRRVLDLVSIVLLIISILACFNIPVLGSMIAYPFLATIFLLHFRPSFKKFMKTNIVLFMVLTILVFLLSALNNLVMPFKNNLLLWALWAEGWRCISLLAILLCNFYIITEKKIFSDKSLYLLICFAAPFLLASEILYIYTVEQLIFLLCPESPPTFSFITKIELLIFSSYCDESSMPSSFSLNIHFYVSVILLVIATGFAYYSFLKLKRNILIQKAESEQLSNH